MLTKILIALAFGVGFMIIYFIGEWIKNSAPSTISGLTKKAPQWLQWNLASAIKRVTPHWLPKIGIWMGYVGFALVLLGGLALIGSKPDVQKLVRSLMDIFT